MTKSTKKAGLVVKSALKAGIIGINHSQSVLSAKKAGLVVKTAVRGGIIGINHSRLLAAA